MMGTFKAYFKKEIVESLRQYKYIILAAGLILFAVLDPLMLNALPNLMKGKIPPEMAALFVTTQKSAVQDYIKNIYQIGSLFVIFSYCGTLSEEVYSHKLVFPYSKGSIPFSIVTAKFIHYSLAVVVFTFLGFMVNYYYVGILFIKDPVSFPSVMYSAALISLYMLFNIALVTLFSSIVKKGLIAGVAVLAISYLSPTLMLIKDIKEYVPYYLVEKASSFTYSNTTAAVVVVTAASVILIISSILRMNKVEVI